MFKKVKNNKIEITSKLIFWNNFFPSYFLYDWTMYCL